MKNWTRRVISILGGIVFGVIVYNLLIIFLDGSFPWMLGLATALFAISTIDKSIIETENRQMLHETLVEDLKKIEEKTKREGVKKKIQSEIAKKVKRKVAEKVEKEVKMAEKEVKKEVAKKIKKEVAKKIRREVDKKINREIKKK